MSEHVLITGGAGFIGSHLADELLRRGYRVRALDNLAAEVHGGARTRPSYLSPDIELHLGDVRDREAVRAALRGVTAVVHFAAKVGVGQSMYRLEEYTSTNVIGTAVLLEALAEKPVRRLVVASSMSVYGEGLYRTQSGVITEAQARSLEQLKRGEWEARSAAGELLTPVPTPETKTPALESVYALSKYDQERLCLIAGRAYGIPTVALRFFNAYGPRQSLGNPYTGVLAIFAAQILNDRRPMIFEDGHQQRDFVSVHDVARATAQALASEAAVGQVINIGSGRPVSVRAIEREARRAIGKTALEPEIIGKYRMGDVRHCFADITLARQTLGYEPRVSLENGLTELSGWLSGQTAESRVAEARAELEARGLTL